MGLNTISRILWIFKISSFFMIYKRIIGFCKKWVKEHLRKRAKKSKTGSRLFVDFFLVTLQTLWKSKIIFWLCVYLSHAFWESSITTSDKSCLYNKIFSFKLRKPIFLIFHTQKMSHWNEHSLVLVKVNDIAIQW